MWPIHWQTYSFPVFRAERDRGEMTWDQILEDYTTDPRSNEEFLRFSEKRAMETLEAAIEMAALSKNEYNQVLSHQSNLWKFNKEELFRSVAALMEAAYRIESCSDFDELFQMVEAVLKETFSSKSRKKVYSYDVAFRIAAWMGKAYLPKQVYLHAGTAEGAVKLGIEGSRRAIEVNELPAELRHLEPWQLEDILCRYKDNFPT